MAEGEEAKINLFSRENVGTYLSKEDRYLLENKLPREITDIYLRMVKEGCGVEYKELDYSNHPETLRQERLVKQQRIKKLYNSTDKHLKFKDYKPKAPEGADVLMLKQEEYKQEEITKEQLDKVDIAKL